MSPFAFFGTDEKFWQDWYRNWLLHGTVYAINHPEPRVVPAETLTIHEGPCPARSSHPDQLEVTLDEAWREAEAALPEGWTLTVGSIVTRGKTVYWCGAGSDETDPDEMRGGKESPIEALREMTERLAALADTQEESHE